MLTGCCCCCSLRTGSILIGVYALVTGLLGLMSVMEAANHLKEQGHDKKYRKQKRIVTAYLIILFIFGVVQVAAGLCIIVAAIMKYPWILKVASFVLLFCMIARLVLELVRYLTTRKGAHHLILMCLEGLLYLYFFMVTLSYAQELMDDEDDDDDDDDEDDTPGIPMSRY